MYLLDIKPQHIETLKAMGFQVNKNTYTYNAGLGIKFTEDNVSSEEMEKMENYAPLLFQQNVTLEGVTEEEIISSYDWILKHIPVCGSNRVDGHSAFNWEVKFHIKKEENSFLINGGERAFSLAGKEIKSPMELEIEANQPQKKNQLACIELTKHSYGTTVTLSEYSSRAVFMFNCSEVWGNDIDVIADKYGNSSSVEWSNTVNGLVQPDTASPAFAVIEFWDGHSDTYIPYYYCPEMDKWIDCDNAEALKGIELPSDVIEAIETLHTEMEFDNGYYMGDYTDDIEGSLCYIFYADID